jgi:hypothetical protein
MAMMDNKPEVWKAVAGHEGRYEISTSWQVASLPRKGRLRRMILKPRLDQKGYLFVTLYAHGKQTHHQIHHLVADAFLPAKGPTDTVVRHLNDNKLDNRVENLAWGTRSDNMDDAIKNGVGFVGKGTANGKAKLTEDNVREIRSLYATDNFSQRELARRFGVGQMVICFVVNRTSWKHVV